ncbi:hypothetical protein [Plantactinospora sp. ZYX-F-223]|uniref:hypothetical protein n=1 Tax=Plantactinospora sp. ZYX-F-223 TaxID=3144103 RepID=UPI0031FE25D0
MAATDNQEAAGASAGLDLDVETEHLKTFGEKMWNAANAFSAEVIKAGNSSFEVPAPEFVEMVEFAKKITDDTVEANRFTADAANGLMSYGSAAIVSFNKYGWGDDQARLSLQDVRDAMKATEQPGSASRNATAA